MRKTPILFLSILITGFIIAPIKPTFAAIKDKGTTWWSVEEMLDFYKEVEVEKDEKCGDNEDCRLEFDYTMVERGPKYSALNNFLEGQTWVTSINPAAETIKVFFFDDDMMLRHMGIEEKLTFEHFYVGWFENWQNQIYNYDHERFTNGSISGVHTMYDSYTDDINNITPWQEVELSVKGSNLIDNASGKLGYAAFANQFNAVGSIDYSNCLMAPDYSDGTECKMMISGDQWIAYFPPREQIIEPNDSQPDYNLESSVDQSEENGQTEQEITLAENFGLTNEQENEPAETVITTDEHDLILPEDPTLIDEQNDSITLISTTIQSPTQGITQSSSMLLSTDSPQLSNLATFTPKAPETGQGAMKSENTIEMPWWLILLKILSIILIKWWFAPSQNVKNFTKNHKKVLTKKGNCDKMVSV